VKRTLICAALVVVGVFCFWYALSGINSPSAPAGNGKSANNASGLQNSTGQGPGPATGATRTANAGGTGGSVAAASDSSAGSPTTSAVTNPLLCKSQCQATSSTCQSFCYQQYSVTNQTQYWNGCMQSCGNKLSVCSNDCVTGISPSSSAPTAILPPPAQAQRSLSQSTPTPSLPPQLPDQSSSSSSSSSSTSSPPPSLQSRY